MKLYLLTFSFLLSLQLSAQKIIDKSINASYSNKTLTEIFYEIEKSNKVKIYFDVNEMPTYRVTRNYKNQQIWSIISELLNGTRLKSLSYSDNSIVIIDFWKEIEEVYTQDGNINNPPPARISTNLTVENRPPVIGFFAMTSTSSDVVFIRKTNLKTSIILRCGSLGGPFPFPYPDECNNCLLLEGSTTTRPDYW